MSDRVLCRYCGHVAIEDGRWSDLLEAAQRESEYVGHIARSPPCLEAYNAEQKRISAWFAPRPK